MKTSNQLLIALFILSLLALTGSAFSLRARFDKIDKSDPFYGYSREPLKPFRHIILEGDLPGFTQIQPGNDHQLLITAEAVRDYITWKQNGDTLMVNFTWSRAQKNAGPNIFNAAPSLYITAPVLAGIRTGGVSARLRDWKSRSLYVLQDGNSLRLTGNHLDSLLIHVSKGGYTSIDSGNILGDAQIRVRDSSRFIVEKDIFRSLTVATDSTAHLSVPGSLFRKISDLPRIPGS